MFCRYLLAFPIFILITLLMIIEFMVKIGTVLLYFPFFLFAGGIIGFKSWRKRGLKCLIIILLLMILPVSFPVAIIYNIFDTTA